MAFTAAGLAKHTVWSRMKHVPDDALEEAFQHISQALNIVNNCMESLKTDQSDHSYFSACSGGRQGRSKHRIWPLKENSNSGTKETMTQEEMLLLAVGEQDEHTLESILARNGSSTLISINYKDASGQTALHIAAERGNLAAVRILLDHGADKDAIAQDGASVLQAAAIGGHVDVCSELLQRGANPDIADLDGDTARICAMDDASESLRDLFSKHEYTDEGIVDEEGDRFLEALDDQESCITWNTDFTEHSPHHRGSSEAVVDRVPSSFFSRRK
eukprot:CAMPEP_0198150896 /NCGR_PEP_ID=MMETSP1443-20131203/53109_1 /TAXON_ID=186043 /ORGANISM="Entomoneis sp., Strain CCMP2396" /LENGTH=273 /DNA_ID=CAMNT_0043816365 /DNA_START=178 /DNA_END=999 /DNA_ORIENTATION=+